MTVADAVQACVKCRRTLWNSELEAGRWACGRCETEAAQRLRALPSLFRRISHLSALMKGATAGGGIGSPNREAPAPLKIHVLSLTTTGGVVTELQTIEDSWRQTLGWTVGATRHHTDIDGATTFLTRNLRWACERYEEVGQDLRLIGTLHGQLTSIDTGTPPPKMFEVYCNTDNCDGAMLVNLNTEYATCRTCGTGYDKNQFRRLNSQYGPNPSRVA